MHIPLSAPPLQHPRGGGGKEGEKRVTEFRIQNCLPTTRGQNFAYEIASRRPADGISHTKLLPDDPLTEFRTRNCFPTTRGRNFAYEIASRQSAEQKSHTRQDLYIENETLIIH